jgi:hypothetical protein
LSKQVIWLNIWLEDLGQEWLKSTELLHVVLTTVHQLWVEETSRYYYQYSDSHDEGSYRPPVTMVWEMWFFLDLIIEIGMICWHHWRTSFTHSHTMVFRVITLCGLLVGCQNFGGMYCLYLQGRSEQTGIVAVYVEAGRKEMSRRW